MTTSPFPGTIAVIGLGYIGLPTAAVLAREGCHVVGVDVNPATLDAVGRGEVPFLEPGLAECVGPAVASGRLTVSGEMPEAAAFIIAVPTPFNPDHTADLTYVRAAAASIAPRLRGGEVVVLESTSPPGTTLAVSELLATLRPDLTFPHSAGSEADVHLAHCPERVLPGRMMEELIANDRVVGGLSPACAEHAAQIYRTFCQGEVQLTDAASAEMAKLVENSYRDVNIAFANELSVICADLGLDVWEVIALANRHPRVNILSPGPGVGGHCIAVDPWFIVGAAPDRARLIRTARDVNDGKPSHVIGEVVAAAEGVERPVVVCLGLAYKANVEDLRESPAIVIVEGIAAALPDADVVAVEPHAPALPGRLGAIPNLRRGELDALSGADVVVLLVDHDEFRVVDPNADTTATYIDTRGFWR